MLCARTHNWRTRHLLYYRTCLDSTRVLVSDTTHLTSSMARGYGCPTVRVLSPWRGLSAAGLHRAPRPSPYCTDTRPASACHLQLTPVRWALTCRARAVPLLPEQASNSHAEALYVVLLFPMNIQLRGSTHVGLNRPKPISSKTRQDTRSPWHHGTVATFAQV